MKKFFVIIFILCNTFLLVSQRQANVWYFGQFAGLDFNTGTAIPLLDGKINRWEGVASFSDSLGHLLFYTDGDSVWNRLHEPMPNGFGLGGHPSSTESAIIVPYPGNDSLFYIFTVDAEGGERGFCYSIVNMNLDNGNGALIVKNIQLQTPVSEKVTAIKHHNNHDFWIITHGWETDSFFVYKVSDLGLDTVPIIVQIGTPHSDIGIHGNNAVGYMRAAPDGSKIALTLEVNEIVEIYDFDNSTGIISNTITVPVIGSPYGVEFSADVTKLYFTSRFSLYQIDLTLSTPAQIINSVTFIDSSITQNYLGALQLGTDGKIYMAHEYQPFLGVVNNPSIKGLGCNFVLNGLYLNGRISRLGLPDFIQTYFIPPPFYAQNICFGDSTKFFLTDSTGIDSLMWNFGDTLNLQDSSNLFVTTHLFSNAGLYNVKVNMWRNGVKYLQSRIIQINPNPQINLGQDTTICSNDSILIGDNCDNCLYRWNTSDTTSYINASDSMQYILNVKNKYTNCNANDTLKLNFFALPAFSLGNDTGFCEFDSIKLQCNLTNVSFLWNNTDTNSFVYAKIADKYYLTVTDSNKCSFSDTLNIKEFQLPQFSIGNDTFLCPNTNILLQSQNFVCYLWNDSSVLSSKLVDKQGLYWLKVTDTNNCSNFDTIEIEQKQIPVVSVNDTIACENTIIRLSAPFKDYTYVWNDSLNQNYLDVSSSGIYKLTAINECGIGTDSIKVEFTYCGDLQIPNIFTPNNDGINDFFKIKGVEDNLWKLEIYNRWGNMVFYSESYKNDWDAKNVSAGNYYYVLSYEKIKLSGFVTVVK